MLPRLIFWGQIYTNVERLIWAYFSNGRWIYVLKIDRSLILWVFFYSLALKWLLSKSEPSCSLYKNVCIHLVRFSCVEFALPVCLLRVVMKAPQIPYVKNGIWSSFGSFCSITGEESHSMDDDTILLKSRQQNKPKMYLCLAKNASLIRQNRNHNR